MEEAEGHPCQVLSELTNGTVLEAIFPRGRLIWFLVPLWRDLNDILPKGWESWVLALLWRVKQKTLHRSWWSY